MKLGATKTFTALGVVDSDPFYPRGDIRQLMSSRATRAGTSRVHMFSRSVGVGTSEAQGSAAIAAALGIPNVFQIEGRFGEADIGFFIRFTDTSNNTGSVVFHVGEDS